MHDDMEEIAQGIQHDGPLTPLHLFARILPAYPTDGGRFDTLTVEYDGTRIGLASDTVSNVVNEGGVDERPRAIVTPLMIVVIHTIRARLLSRQVDPIDSLFAGYTIWHLSFVVY